MPVPSDIADLDTIKSANSPAGTDAIGTTADDYIRALSAFIAQVRDGSKNLERGTSTAPALAFLSDPNTGIMSGSADVVNVVTGGVVAVTASATGTSIAGTLAASGKLYGNYSGSGLGLGTITVSTSAPSGGASGDVWFQY